jgi:hypothetical protein
VERAGAATRRPQQDKEVHEMNGTMRRLLGRSVQLAVMATPSTTVVDAVAEARRRHDPAVVVIADAARGVASRRVHALAS